MYIFKKITNNCVLTDRVLIRIKILNFEKHIKYKRRLQATGFVSL